MTLTVGGSDLVASLSVLRRPYTADEVPNEVDQPDSDGDGVADAIDVEINPYLATTTTTTTTTTTAGGIGSWVRSTLWNFPNAHTVRLQSGGDGVWGTVFAPAAHVISNVKIEGGVVAAQWTHDGREVNGARVFTGQIDWDS
jgi:hypothetical protein